MTLTPAFPRSKPESLGISSTALHQLLDAIAEKKLEIHSFMLVRHGQVAAEAWWAPYSAERTHLLFSLSKSFTSTAVGMAISEGLLSLEDRAASFFPDELPDDPSEFLLRMTIRDLLIMGTGHTKDTFQALNESTKGGWGRMFLEQPVEVEPGTQFVYNSGATYMLSSILQKVTGVTLTEYLTPRLFEPLGIVDPSWDKCPDGIVTGGWGLKLKTEDIAKFGQLYLQQGEWNGRQLISPDWITEATSKQISNGSSPDSDWTMGYGYQFWLCRHNAYRGDGAFGQFCIMLPDQHTVIAITAALTKAQELLELIWTHVLPNMSDQPLAEDADAWSAWEERIQALGYGFPSGHTAVDWGLPYNGIVYRMEGVPELAGELSFRFDKDEALMCITNQNGRFSIPLGMGRWHESETSLLGRSAEPILTAAAWKDAGELALHMRFIEMPFMQAVNCTFGEDGNSLTVRIESNLRGGSFPDLVLTGKAI
jgi:CubicO group peptidase (beta-lactamase class C family)